MSLDRPVWASLCTFHRCRSEGDDRARRFARDVNLFAAAREGSPEDLAALAALVAPGETLYLAERHANRIPEGLRLIRQTPGVQMIAPSQARFSGASEDMRILGDADAPEMLALARLTQPGPFLERTHTMGTFIGIRIGGRLAAMAGERMRFPGHTEVSGVCTHPDFRGRGLAHRLSSAVAAAIVARGETPFLHAWASNEAAIRLYESLGFHLRTEVAVAALTRD